MSEIQYLRLLIDDTLSWNSHINSLCSQIARQVGNLKRLKQKLNTRPLKTIYFSMIQSKLYYIVNAWGSAKATLIKRVAVLQSRALKQVFRLLILHPTKTLYSVVAPNILPITSIYKKSIVTYVQQCLLNCIHHNSQFEYISHQANTRLRGSKKLKLPKIRTMKYGTHSIRSNAANFYNTLPQDITELKDIRKFKSEVTKWLQKKSESKPNLNPDFELR